jgi:putative thiamine transport system permease protein
VGPHTRDTVRPFVARFSSVSFYGLALVYLITTFTLLVLSFATLWPFPNLWPEKLSFSAWVRVVQNPTAIVTSLVLAITTTATALLMAVSWLESQPQSRDRHILILGAVALAVPAILFSLGQYRALLHIGLTGTALGVFIAHLVPVTAYMFFILVGPYRSFDPRWRSSAYGLLSNFPRFFWHIKLPLLKAPLLGASAVGFAVSFGQYVPAQLIASGRYSTLPMEAVTLTSGTNRPLTAAFGLLLMVPPLLVFLGATYFGRPRWSDV